MYQEGGSVLFLYRNFACDLASFCQMNGIIFISFHFMRPQSQVFIFSPVRLFSFCFFLSELAGRFSRSVSLSWALSPYFELSRLDGFSASFASRLWKENLREENAAMPDICSHVLRRHLPVFRSHLIQSDYCNRRIDKIVQGTSLQDVPNG